MPEMNTIYDSDSKIVGIFRFGVAWSRDPRVRLGEYDDTGPAGQVYDNNRNVVARFSDGLVSDLDGNQIGSFMDGQLQIGDSVVGRCIGNDGAAAAALALIFGSNTLP
ncbi:MAG: hypothetical protein AAFX44_01930 [Pseudomonadota bacterium]